MSMRFLAQGDKLHDTKYFEYTSYTHKAKHKLDDNSGQLMIKVIFSITGSFSKVQNYA